MKNALYYSCLLNNHSPTNTNRPIYEKRSKCVKLSKKNKKKKKENQNGQHFNTFSDEHARKLKGLKEFSPFFNVKCFLKANVDYSQVNAGA